MTPGQQASEPDLVVPLGSGVGGSSCRSRRGHKLPGLGIVVAGEIQVVITVVGGQVVKSRAASCRAVVSPRGIAVGVGGVGEQGGGGLRPRHGGRRHVKSRRGWWSSSAASAWGGGVASGRHLGQVGQYCLSRWNRG